MAWGQGLGGMQAGISRHALPKAELIGKQCLRLQFSGLTRPISIPLACAALVA